MARLTRKVLVALDGQRLKKMHRAISEVGMVCNAQGLVRFGKDCGLLVSKGGEGRVVCLGVNGTKYVLREASDGEAYFENLLCAAAVDLPMWPTTPRDAEAFAKKMFAWLPEVQQRARVLSNTPKTKSYNMLSLLRKHLLVLESPSQRGPCVFDAVPFAVLRTWCPDERNHLDSAPALGTMSSREVRIAFGMSALMLPCWACFGKEAEPKLEVLTYAKPIDVLHSLDRSGH